MYKKKINTAASVIAGLLFGYIILHPLSYLIINLSGSSHIRFLDVLSRSFDLSHMNMAAYFMILGAIISSLYAVYINQQHGFYYELIELNRKLKIQNSDLKEQLNVDSKDINIFFRQIWPTFKD